MQKILQFTLCLVTLILAVKAKPTDNDGRIFFPDHDFESEVLIDSTESDDQKSIDDANIDLESGQNFQGDIILLPDQKEIFFANETEDGNFTLRTGLLLESHRWPKNQHKFVVVPFTIENKNNYSKISVKNFAITFFDFLCAFSCQPTNAH